MKNLPKTDVRYWGDKITQRTNAEWHARIRFGGVQRWWPLKTANREQAASKARDIWLSLQTHGFESTEAKFKPWTVAPVINTDKHITVGDFLKAVTAVAVVRPTTLTTYGRKLRFLVSQVTDGLPGKPLDGEIWAGRDRFEEARCAVQYGHWTHRCRFVAFDAPAVRGTWQRRMASAARLWRDVVALPSVTGALHALPGVTGGELCLGWLRSR